MEAEFEVKEALKILRANPNPPRTGGYVDLPLLEWDRAENTIFTHVFTWVKTQYPNSQWMRMSHTGWWSVRTVFHIYGDRGPLYVQMDADGVLCVEEKGR